MGACSSSPSPSSDSSSAPQFDDLSKPSSAATNLPPLSPGHKTGSIRRNSRPNLNADLIGMFHPTVAAAHSSPHSPRSPTVSNGASTRSNTRDAVDTPVTFYNEPETPSSPLTLEEQQERERLRREAEDREDQARMAAAARREAAGLPPRPSTKAANRKSISAQKRGSIKGNAV